MTCDIYVFKQIYQLKQSPSLPAIAHTDVDDVADVSQLTVQSHDDITHIACAAGSVCDEDEDITTQLVSPKLAAQQVGAVSKHYCLRIQFPSGCNSLLSTTIMYRLCSQKLGPVVNRSVSHQTMMKQ